eukprot:TRINITY_DN4985_c0_g1_i1.p1 TRINITY_DN4985_c0_g1~~TRINITY_DN4985_c0_g1_i1.p1  ORF type:complete len:164 (-),score=33.81 TRINITY_DN4985_c0_g1_i1:8-499(-)
MEKKKHSVLFVCLGNICRSPMAEMVMKYIIKQNQIESEWRVDSAGTSAFHIGQKADGRSIETCRKRLKNIDDSHRARQLRQLDFSEFDYILCMDESNLRNIEYAAPDSYSAKIKLLGSYDSKGMKIIEDPYYGGAEGFDTNFDQVVRSLLSFLSELGYSSIKI